LEQINLLKKYSSLSNKVNCPSPRGGNSKGVKIHQTILNIFFSRTSRPKSIKFGKKISLDGGNSSLFEEIARFSSKGR
jgi:hypothetical protein